MSRAAETVKDLLHSTADGWLTVEVYCTCSTPGSH